MGAPFLRTYLDFYPQCLEQLDLINVFWYNMLVVQVRLDKMVFHDKGLYV
jgi:hypothetical protein